MKIKHHQISVKDVVSGYIDNQDDGVTGYGGKLDIRPPFQREFVYDNKQRNAVINSIFNGFPLNVMYWSVRDDGTYEVLDGQQRTISIAQFVQGDFSFNGKYYHNLLPEEQKTLDEYKLSIYFCSGTDSEKLEWFEIINIAGEQLYKQELRNAVYAGTWVTDAKRIFSKNNCPAYGLAKDYIAAKLIRQGYLETAISWINNNDITGYMSKNQHEPNANELWLYFQSVINWVSVTFPTYRKEMKEVNWGELYNEFKDKKFDPKKLESEITKLMVDEDVTKKSGIYPFVLTRKQKYLNIRAFTDNMKREAYERQKGMCAISKQKFDIDEMEADHIKPWHEGGKTIAENCQMLSKEENRKKSGN